MQTLGLLLDFHISKDAREKLLGQVGLQSYTQVFSVLRSVPRFSVTRPGIRRHVENMLSRFKSAYEPDRLHPDVSTKANPSGISGSKDAQLNSSFFLMLSAPDALALVNALFPRDSSQPHNQRAGFESGTFRPNADGLFPPRFPFENQMFPSDMGFLSYSPVDSLAAKVDRIRMEISDVTELDGRTALEYPSTEDWAIFSVSASGNDLNWGLFPAAQDPSTQPSVDDIAFAGLSIEDNQEALQTAVVRLVHDEGQEIYDSHRYSLGARFDRAMSLCEQESDFIGAHYWWSAKRQLLRSNKGGYWSSSDDDRWILAPMRDSCKRSLKMSESIAGRCEAHSLMLERSAQRLQATIKGLVGSMTKLRNKMWYMTDVKNSMRYEEAKHVALALKTMIYSAQLFQQTQREPPQQPPPPPRILRGSRSLGGSLLQKPEVQVMDVMKAPSGQGGPNKLSDEQVDITRKWLTYSGIDNFCKGEERIHRFCYEVRGSIRRLVGETMAETPVLWASELFQRERAKYEAYGSRRVVSGLASNATTGMRSSSSSVNEDAFNVAQLYGTIPRRWPRRESIFSSRMPIDSVTTPPTPSIPHKMSFQSLGSERLWSSPAEYSPSFGGGGDYSPGKATSTSTADSCSTFWSGAAPGSQTQYAASASSVYSPAPSMSSDPTPAPSAARRSDRTVPQQGKAAFLQEIREGLTSLLLSDLGSPVWSCGSESDHWFLNALNDRGICAQMKKRARVQAFYADYEEVLVARSDAPGGRDGCSSAKSRRSKSLERDPVVGGSYRSTRPTARQIPTEGENKNDQLQAFPFEKSFGQLLESFSRHANPFAKLKALSELRLLVIASLNLSAERRPSWETAPPRRRRSDRNSFSGFYRADEYRGRHGFYGVSHLAPHFPPAAGAAESVVFDSRHSVAASPSEMQIVDFLRKLILEFRPKTLFRDLQFISAFVPSDILSKTHSDSDTAFLQFGLAALSLKDEVCNSMVEIADSIISEELNRRHHHYHHHHTSPPYTPSSTSVLTSTSARSQSSEQSIRAAAGMWIITAKEGNPIAQRELAILYLTHPELLPLVTLPLTQPRDTFKTEMMYLHDDDSKSDPQSMCLALHWMQLSANGGDELAKNRLRERVEFDSIA